MQAGACRTHLRRSTHGPLELSDLPHQFRACSLAHGKPMHDHPPSHYSSTACLVRLAKYEIVEVCQRRDEVVSAKWILDVSTALSVLHHVVSGYHLSLGSLVGCFRVLLQLTLFAERRLQRRQVDSVSATSLIVNIPYSSIADVKITNEMQIPWGLAE